MMSTFCFITFIYVKKIAAALENEIFASREFNFCTRLD